MVMNTVLLVNVVGAAFMRPPTPPNLLFGQFGQVNCRSMRATPDVSLDASPSSVYGSSITVRDITSGNNGAPCLVGYDLVTGRGSWIGTTP